MTVQRKTTCQFINEVKTLTNGEYQVLSSYVNAHTKVIIKHSKCGNTYGVTPNQFLNGNRCPECRKTNMRKRFARSQEDFSNLIEPSYTLIGQYINNATLIEIKCNKCGLIFNINPHNFLARGKRCPICYKNISRGEQKVRESLIKAEVDFTPEKTFPWSKRYRYDFFLPEFDLIIEYHGIQHYKQNHFFEPLKVIQNRDKDKERLALIHGKEYLIIPYWEKDDLFNIINNKIKEEYYKWQ